MTSFSGVTFVLFCFVFVSMFSLKPRRGPSFNRPSICRRLDSQRVSFFFLPFVCLEMSFFPSIFCTITVLSLYGEYVVRSFLPDSVFSTL